MTRITSKGPTARARAAKARKDAAYAKKIREQVFERDGGCRVAKDLGMAAWRACGGGLQWAHLGDKRRFNTRGLPPEERHTTAGSLVLCDKHHDDYDQHRMHIWGDADHNLAISFSSCVGVHAKKVRL